MTRRRLALTAAVLVLGSVLLMAQTYGPLTPLMNIRTTTDSNGSLNTVGRAYQGPNTPLTPMANLQGRTDSNGSLVTTVAGGVLSPDSLCIDAANDDTGLSRVAANNWAFTNCAASTYWTVGSLGIRAGTDSTLDIGGVATGRPRDLNIGRNAVIAAALTTGGTTIIGGNLIANTPSGGGLIINNSASPDGPPPIGQAYMTFQTAGTPRYYMGMSANGSTGNFDLYDNIASLPAWSIVRDTAAFKVSTRLDYANLAVSLTAPTIASGFGTSPTVTTPNGTAAFTVNIGTGAVATNGVLTMPAAATSWTCMVNDLTAAAAHVAYNTRQTASTTTSVTLENQTTSTGAAIAWPAGDTLRVMCTAY